MQYQESRRVRGATPAVREQGVLCEDKVCSIRNVTSAVLRERKYAVPEGSHLQYEKKVVQCGE